MSETDSPLKLWARENIHDLAAWLLGQEVVAAEEDNVELTTEIPPRIDLVFRLQLADQRTCLFHLEFQGRRSRPEMPRRQLDHLTRLALRADWPVLIESFVLYIEKYAGSRDRGSHEVKRVDGSPALAWNYTPIHLWRLPAESLLSIDRPGIIPLVGLMQIQQPATTLPKVVERIRVEPDEARRSALFTALLALMEDKEHLAMLKNLVESDEFILDTPFLREMRQQGAQEARREDILRIFAERFGPPIQVSLDVDRQLKLVGDLQDLDRLFAAALRTKTLDLFLATLSEVLNKTP
ncbi:MAG: hypothetical protein AB1791_10560 [Chloroflexota bacterium]